MRSQIASTASSRWAGITSSVPELESLVKQYPLRERLRSQLMLALYRSGRQADALAAYQDARRTLVEELGLEPGRELQELEQAILMHDATLEATSAAPLGSQALRRRGGVLATVSGMGIAAVLALALSSVFRSGSGGLSTISPSAVGVIDPKSNAARGRGAGGHPSRSLVRRRWIGVGGQPRRRDGVANRSGRAEGSGHVVSGRVPERGCFGRTISLGRPGGGKQAREGRAGVQGSANSSPGRRTPSPRSLRRDSAPGQGVGGAGMFAGRHQHLLARGSREVSSGTSAAGALDVNIRRSTRASHSLRPRDEGSGPGLRRESVPTAFSDIAYGLGSAWVVNWANTSVFEVDPATNKASAAARHPRWQRTDGDRRRRGPRCRSRTTPMTPSRGSS